MSNPIEGISRRTMMEMSAGLAAGAALPRWANPMEPSDESRVPSKPKKMIGIQIGAISFVDEGVNRVLDILQERGKVNTLFISSFTYDGGTGGRQVKSRPLPDHGKQEYDDFHGGNFATPHPQFYTNTIFRDTKAPDHGNLDIFDEVIPEAKKRGMGVYAWNYNIFRTDTPHVEFLEEVDIDGNRRATCCAYNPDYREFVIGLTRDHCTSYDIDGVMWGAEQQGPLNNLIGSNTWSHPATCFCRYHRQAAAKRGIDVKRAIEGYKKLAQFVADSRVDRRPTDGYFVQFWRIMVDYPEILAWEKLWNDGKNSTYKNIFDTAKSVRANLQVGFHIWHTNSFSPFFRAEQDFERYSHYADFIKPVLYNNCAGPRYATYIENIQKTIFHDAPAQQVLDMNNKWLNYDEMSLSKIPTSGLSADYVFCETKRSLDDVNGKCKIYPGIDIDIPTNKGEKETSPEDVYAATTAALKAGAEGVVFSRKYSEMLLANLSGGGRAVADYHS
jgi:hypothetical protein